MDDNAAAFSSQEQETRCLIGYDTGLHLWMRCCPKAHTLTGWSITLESNVVIATSCNQWSCPICGRKKVQHYARRVAEAEANKLITLTVNPVMHDSPRAAYDATRKKIPDLTKLLRKGYGEFEFFRILEATKKGWPHYHLIARSPYIPQAELSDLWRQLTGAPIVDVRKMDRKNNAYWYVVKYLAKQSYIPWTNRRASWTKKFFPPTEFEKGPTLDIPVISKSSAHPASFCKYNYEGMHLDRYSDTCWVLGGKKKMPWD